MAATVKVVDHRPRCQQYGWSERIEARTMLLGETSGVASNICVWSSLELLDEPIIVIPVALQRVCDLVCDRRSDRTKRGIISADRNMGVERRELTFAARGCCNY